MASSSSLMLLLERRSALAGLRPALSFRSSSDALKRVSRSELRCTLTTALGFGRDVVDESTSLNGPRSRYVAACSRCPAVVACPASGKGRAGGDYTWLADGR